MKNNHNLETIWRKVPVDYYETGVKNNLGQRLWHKQKVTALFNIVEGLRPVSILDIGSNGGIMTAKIAGHFPTAKVIGIDAYKEAVNYASARHSKVKFLTADAHCLPFGRSSFDLVFCLETLEHLISPRKALKEMKRCLKKNGRIIVSMDTGSRLFSLIWFFWTKFGRGRVWQGSHLYHFNRRILIKMIEETGLIIEKEIISHLGMATTLRIKKGNEK